MFRKMIEKFIAKRAAKFLVATIGGGVTWVAAHGIPLDQWLTDSWVHATGGALTAGLVYLVRNVGD